MNIRVIIHHAEEGGYWAEVPSLPGCVTQGADMEEIEANVREAVAAWFSAGEDIDITDKEDRILEMAV